MQQEIDHTKERENAKQMYLLLALGMVLFWIPYGIAMVASSVFFIGAAIVCHSRVKQAGGTYYQSHYRWMIRTFWIGTGLLLPIAIAVMVWIVLQTGDLSAFDELLSMGLNISTEVVDKNINQFLHDNWKILSLSLLTTCVPVMVWWYRRLWIGYKYLRTQEPVENVKTWLF